MAQTHSTDLEVGSLQNWSIADGSQTGLDPAGGFSMSSWFKFESLPGSGSSFYLASKYDSSGGNQRGYIWDLRNTAGTIAIRLATSSDGSAVSTASFNTSLSTGTWYHIVTTFNTTGPAVKMYLDKTELTLSSGGAAASIFNSTAPFIIGSIGNGASSEDYDGLIDEFLFYSATLSQSDVNALYDTPCSPSTTNLVSQWQFNGDGTDSFGSNDLTNNNSCTFSTDVPFNCASASYNGLFSCHFA